MTTIISEDERDMSKWDSNSVLLFFGANFYAIAKVAMVHRNI
jgi:hypothetical protein